MKTGGTDETAEGQVLCSRCLKVFGESQIHVIPYFNETAGGYVTTYRCERCWLPSLAETHERLTQTRDADETASAAMVFQRHGVFIHEYRRGDPMEVVRQILIQMLGMIETGAIRLSIGAAELP